MEYSISNLEADLDVLKLVFIKASEPEREKVKMLISTCLKELFPNSDSDDVSSENLRVVVPFLSGALGDSVCHDICDVCPNPLEVELIYMSIFSYLSINSLLNCRLVNRSWNARTAFWIQERIKHRLSRFVEISRLCVDFEKAKVSLLTKLVFKMEGLRLRDCSNFFMKHGSQIRTMHIYDEQDYLDFEEEKDYDEMKLIRERRSVLRHIFLHVPNLTLLGLWLPIQSVIVSDEFIFNEKELQEVILPQVVSFKFRCGYASQGFLDGLFTMIPNVQVIQFGFWVNDNPADFVACLRKLKVHTLIDTRRTLIEGDLWSLLAADATTSLKKLKIRMNVELPDSEEKLLRSQADILEVLTIEAFPKFDVRRPTTPRLQLPVMKRLRKLTFEYVMPLSTYNWNPCFPIEPELLPNLTTLCIQPSLLKFDVFTNSVYKSVLEIHLNGWKDAGNHVQILPELEAMFPNLKKLYNFQTPLDNALMSLIAQHLKHIEDLELKIIGDIEQMKGINLVMSGISVENGKAVAHLANLVRYTYLPSLIDPPCPTIRELIGLKKLVLAFESCERGAASPVRIDGISVYFTFLRLSPQLRLILRGNFSISDSLAAMLTAHYQNIYFIPSEQSKEV